ncbi:uncharacterized protein [Aegilops tauschii subsp. strangulata]|uniref:uncharacterized protein n=1 Tax=Aegilops tauschii subsp. strangulata TaxID=200361 RepID=UPI00098B9597|nr:nascent polypeptide-associated complex subunit alpha, muscle-specific form-like [Aegilops tauschii subsp. strangulata]
MTQKSFTAASSPDVGEVATEEADDDDWTWIEPFNQRTRVFWHVADASYDIGVVDTNELTLVLSQSVASSGYTINSNPFADANPPNVNDIRNLNIYEWVPVRLSQTDSSYYAWKTYFSLVFREYHLIDHVDGSVDSNLIPDFHDWSTIDATLIRWFFLTISPDLFQTVVQDGQLLRRRLLSPPKTLADELRDIGAKIDDDLLLSTLTAGLNEDFGNAAANLTLIPEPSFTKFVAYLRLEERRMKQVKARAIHTALAAGTTSGCPRRPGRTSSAAPPGAVPATAAAATAASPVWASRHARATCRTASRRLARRPAAAAGTPRQQQQLQVPPPWAAGYNPWTGVVHAYTMPVPRAPASTLPVPRPPAHQAYYAAPQPCGGYPSPQLSGGYRFPMASPPPSPALPPAPWDPALLAVLHTAPTPNNYTGGGDWYMDTGATTHMFAHPGNLASFTPITTDRRIIVGDDSTLPITHVGHTSFPSNSMPLSLSNILVSPHLIKNLISVVCFTRENPVTVEFDELGFCVKDARTRMQFGAPARGASSDRDSGAHGPGAIGAPLPAAPAAPMPSVPCSLAALAPLAPTLPSTAASAPVA